MVKNYYNPLFQQDSDGSDVKSRLNQLSCVV